MPFDSDFSEPSGFFINAGNNISSEFTDFRILTSSDYHFIAKAVRYGKVWILKGLNADYRHNDVCLEMLAKEFDIMMRLAHDNIVHAFSFEPVDGYGPCIVMEYIDGETLIEWLRAKPSLSRRYNVARQIISAMAHIADNGVVHRDIKPENILISRVGNRVKVIDFGLSDTDDYAVFKHPAGTEKYISPEQQTSAIPDVRNDIYSFGKVLDRLLPEKRFAHTRHLCTVDIERRLSDFEDITRRLERNLKSRRRMYILSAPFIILAIAFCLVIILRKPVQEKIAPQPEKATPQNIAPANTEPESDAPVIIPTEESETKLKVSSDAVLPIEEKTNILPTINNENTNPAKDLTDVVRKGAKLIDAKWQSTAVAYLDTIRNPEAIVSDWSLTQIENIRDNYISSLQETYSAAELSEIEKQLNNHIDKIYDQWNQRRLQMKWN